MYLSKLLLQNFRSYDSQIFEFDSKFNLILGPNGSGKTNILESIFFLSSGKSFRSTGQSKLINWYQNFASVRAVLVDNQGDESKIEIKLIKAINSPKNSISRKFSIGNNQDFTLNSALNLQLVGELSEDLSIVANITDKNVPIQPEGNSRMIQDFNKIFLQLNYNSCV